MKKLIILSLTAAAILSFNASAEDVQSFDIVIKNHQFSPETIEIPAGKKVKLVIDNHDSTPEEFESFELSREKVIKGNSKASVFIGPLKAGEYGYFGEFNKDTAKGKIIAK